jgi:hypothetical protein
MSVDTAGDVALTVLGIAAAMTCWTAVVTMRRQYLSRLTGGVAALGWSILSGRWLYVATTTTDWISAAWPSQLGMILLALASILAGWLATFAALRAEHVRLTKARRDGSLWS